MKALKVPAGRWRPDARTPAPNEPLAIEPVATPLHSSAGQWWWVLGYRLVDGTRQWVRVQVQAPELVAAGLLHCRESPPR